MAETVNHPPHYRGMGGMECIDVIDAYALDFYLGNVVKYVLRAERKGSIVDDLKKARWYLDRKISLIQPPQQGAEK